MTMAPIGAAAAVVVVAAAAEPEGHAGQHGDGGGKRGGDRADQDVAVQHVAQLVRDHAFELAIVHQLQDAGGERHRGVLRIAAGGEGVGRILGDHPQLRHRQAHALAEIPHHRRDAAVDLRVLGLA